jgi:hypothetical protein
MSSLPTFPNFELLNLTHRELLRKIAQEFPTYSDFNFVSMFTWNNDGNISVADFNGNLVVRFSDYENGEIFLSFLGINKLANTIETLLEYCVKNNMEPRLRLIGQSIIDNLPKSVARRYQIQADRDNHDYILSTELLADLNKAHQRKRSKLRHFEREYGSKAQYRELDLTINSTILEIDNLLLDWQKIRLKKDSDVRREFTAIKRSLTHASELNMLGYGTYVDKKLVAFTLLEIVHNKTAMLHFGKSNTTLTGSSEAHHNQMASYLVSKGIEFMNNEQDLGIEGLRHAKMSSQPVKFLKKYTVSLK